MVQKSNNAQTLLVEGKTDQHVVLALCNHYQVEENFDIKDCDGISNLFKELKLRLSNPSNVKTIGVILDADNDITARLDEIRSITSPSGYQIPKSLPKTGLVCVSSDSIYPKLGLWLMPDNVSLGMVEDFALSLVPQNEPLMSNAETTLQQLETSGIQKYKPNHRSKAMIHTYLAWQDEPGTPIGHSITKQVLNPNHPNAQAFVQNWLVPLFQ